MIDRILIDRVMVCTECILDDEGREFMEVVKNHPREIIEEGKRHSLYL